MRLGLGLGVGRNKKALGANILLDKYPGAEVAYSLRYLSSSYTGDVILARRGADDVEEGFTPTEINDGTFLSWVNSGEEFTNPNITSATGWVIGGSTAYNAGTEAFDLTSETGLTVRQNQSVNGVTYNVTLVVSSYTSGTIKIYAGGTQSAEISSVGTHTLSIVGGSSNAIFGINPGSPATLSISSFSAINVSNGEASVKTIYDQSGNGRDLIQTTIGNQPKIAASGAIIVENNLPSISFDGIAQWIKSSAFTAVSQPFTTFFVGNPNNASFISDGNTTYQNALRNSNIGQFEMRNDTTTISDSYTQGDQLLGYALTNGASSEIAANGGIATTGSVGANNQTAVTLGRAGGSSLYGDVKIQEFILWGSDESSNRSAIETLINEYYTIF